MIEYYGRVLGAGKTKDNNPTLIYFASCRSKAFKDRILKLKESVISMIKSTGKYEDEQAKIADILFYDAIVTSENSQLLLASNGDHTANLVDTWKPHLSSLDGLNQSYLEEVLRERGFEDDEQHTPRLAAEVYGNQVNLAMITDIDYYPIKLNLEEFEPGEFRTIPTYNGDVNKPRAPKMVDLTDAISVFYLKSSDAQGLAEEFFEYFNPKFRFASGAAVYENGGWTLGTKNIRL